jgi:hypothetical protein
MFLMRGAGFAFGLPGGGVFSAMVGIGAANKLLLLQAQGQNEAERTATKYRDSSLRSG